MAGARLLQQAITPRRTSETIPLVDVSMVQLRQQLVNALAERSSD